jgi:hypothetical protein
MNGGNKKKRKDLQDEKNFSPHKNHRIIPDLFLFSRTKEGGNFLHQITMLPPSVDFFLYISPNILLASFFNNLYYIFTRLLLILSVYEINHPFTQLCHDLGKIICLCIIFILCVWGIEEEGGK